MRGGVQAPERWAGAQEVPRPVFWGASLATFDCGKKDGGGEHVPGHPDPSLRSSR